MRFRLRRRHIAANTYLFSIGERIDLSTARDPGHMLLHIFSENYLQLTDESVEGTVVFNIMAMQPSKTPNKIVLLFGEFTAASSVQLEDPDNSLVILTLNMETGKRQLVCGRKGTATIRKVEALADGTWTTSFRFMRTTHQWSLRSPQYRRRQRVKVWQVDARLPRPL